MKKILKYLFGAALFCGMTVSCYDDKSTLDNNPIPGIVIESTVEKDIYTSLGATIKIDPTVTRGTDDSELSYEWTITVAPSGTTGLGDREFIVIGDAKELVYEVNRPVAAVPYFLLLTVTDTKNGGLQKQMSWNVYVSSAYGEGLMVCDTKDNLNSDLSLIMDKNITEIYDNSTPSIFRDLRTTLYGAPIEGLVKKLNYAFTGNYNQEVNYIWAATEAGYTLFSCVDYSVASNQNAMLYRPPGFAPTAFHTLYNDNKFVIANNRIYQIGQYYYTPYFPVENLEGQPYYIGDKVSVYTGITTYWIEVYPAGDISEGKPVRSTATLMWYDDVNHKFLRALTYTPSDGQAYIGEYKYYPERDAYDLGAVAPGTSKAAGVSSDGKTHSILLKDNATGNYTVHSTSIAYFIQSPDTRYDMVVKSAVNIPAAHNSLLDNAVSVFFCKEDPLMYIVSANAVHVFNMFNLQLTSDVYTVPAGETITIAYLFTQGFQTVKGAFYETAYFGQPARYTAIPWSNKAIVLATAGSGGEGFVYAIPQRNPGTGLLDAAAAQKYGGFGKILDVIPQGRGISLY